MLIFLFIKSLFVNLLIDVFLCKIDPLVVYLFKFVVKIVNLILVVYLFFRGIVCTSYICLPLEWNFYDDKDIFKEKKLWMYLN